MFAPSYSSPLNSTVSTRDGVVSKRAQGWRGLLALYYICLAGIYALLLPFSLLCGIWSIFSDRAIDYEEEEGDFPEISTDALVKVGMSGVGILRFRKDRILMSSQASLAEKDDDSS